MTKVSVHRAASLLALGLGAAVGQDLLAVRRVFVQQRLDEVGRIGEHTDASDDEPEQAERICKCGRLSIRRALDAQLVETGNPTWKY